MVNLSPKEELNLREELGAGVTPDRELEIREQLATPEQLSGIEKQKGFIDRVGERFEERRGEVTETFESAASGEIGPIEAGIQILGKAGAGGTLDVLGEGLVSAGRGISFLTPDSIEEPVVNAFKEGFKSFIGTDLGMAAEEAIKGGVDKWNKFREENPQDAKTLESIVNVGVLLAPVKAKAKAEPTVLGAVRKKVGETAAKQISVKKGKFASDLVKPIPTKKVLIAETARTTEVGKGPLKRSVVAPSARETEIASEVAKIKNVSSKNTTQGNLNAISGENARLARKLELDVAKSNVAIPHKDAINSIDDAINIVIGENPLIVGNLQTTASRVADKAKNIISDNPQTASGLLKSRKEFDSWVRTLPRGEAKLSADAAMEAQSVAIKSVRNAMNDMLDSKVKNTAVKRELKRQSLLFDAIENVAPKAAAEANTAIGRAWQNAIKVIPFKNKAIQEMALITGIGGLGAAAKFAPVISIFGAGALTTIGLSKLLLNPKGKIAVGKTLKMIDQAINSSKNPSMIKQLRADRALIVEALKNSETVKEEE